MPIPIDSRRLVLSLTRNGQRVYCWRLFRRAGRRQADWFCRLSQRKGTDVWFFLVAVSKRIEPFCGNRDACVDCGAALLKAGVEVRVWVGGQTVEFRIC